MADDSSKARLKEDDWKQYGDKAPESSPAPAASTDKPTTVVADKSAAVAAAAPVAVVEKAAAAVVTAPSVPVAKAAPAPVGDYSL